MLDLVALHEIKVKTNAFFGLDQIPNLLNLVHTGKMTGKGIIVVSEDEQKLVGEGKAPRV